MQIYTLNSEVEGRYAVWGIILETTQSTDKVSDLLWYLCGLNHSSTLIWARRMKYENMKDMSIVRLVLRLDLAEH